MFHVKSILSVAVSMVLYTTILPGTATASSNNDQILLTANQQTQRSVQINNRRNVYTSTKSIQQQDRIRDRQRLDPQGTPNEDPPSKTGNAVLLSDQQQDRVRDRLREDPQGTPNENPPSKDD